MKAQLNGNTNIFQMLMIIVMAVLPLLAMSMPASARNLDNVSSKQYYVDTEIPYGFKRVSHDSGSNFLVEIYDNAKYGDVLSVTKVKNYGRHNGNDIIKRYVTTALDTAGVDYYLSDIMRNVKTEKVGRHRVHSVNYRVNSDTVIAVKTFQHAGKSYTYAYLNLTKPNIYTSERLLNTMLKPLKYY